MSLVPGFSALLERGGVTSPHFDPAPSPVQDRPAAAPKALRTGRDDFGHTETPRSTPHRSRADWRFRRPGS